MQFRNRDLVAVLLALILSRMAWNDNVDSLSATVHLAFYIPNPNNDEPRSVALAPFDVDGDGTSEALAMVTASDASLSSSASERSSDTWKIQILDLNPLHQAVDVSRMAPFQPKQLFASAEIASDGKDLTFHFFPLQLATGQILMRRSSAEADKDAQAKVKPEVQSDHQLNNRTRHYFCGKTWHEAAEACSMPCPSGQSNECPEDERCFADTPCDALNPKQHGASSTPEGNEVPFHLTPGGGLPSIVSLWSDGVLQMHSLTADKPTSASDSDQKNKNGVKAKQHLELKQMWKIRILPEHVKMNKIDWEEGGNIQFLDSVDSLEAEAEHGMILVRGEYFNIQEEKDEHDGGADADMDDDDIFVSFITAVDAMTGKVMWASFSNGDDLGEGNAQPLPLPIQRGASSSARRRSRIPTIHQAHSLRTRSESGSMTNCLSILKHCIGDVLPYAYWGPEDSGMTAMHLNQRTRSVEGKHTEQNGNEGKGMVKHHDHHHLSKTLGHSASMANAKKAKRKWHHRFHRKINTDRVFGRPNVVVTHSHGGLKIRSLKNGHMVCHLSLLEGVVYADLNSDGMVDQVQLLVGASPIRDHFVWKLADRVKKEKNKVTMAAGSRLNVTVEDSPNLCHAMALSGLPAKEELFSSSLCNGGDYQYQESDTLTSTTPIVVESLDGHRGSRDIVIAMGNGVVHRLDGATGRHEWQTVGKKAADDFPNWEGSYDGLVYTLLSRVQTDMVPPPLRPILLAGQNSLAILSAKSGSVLSTTTFPQESNRRPILTDVNGDGTTDVLVTTEDAVWGFQIVVTPGTPIILRTLVGLLFMGIMLATVSNRNGQRQDKRSSDE